MDTDRYGRTVAWVFVDGNNLNEEIVRAGFAWHFKKYSKDENLVRAEIEAREKKLAYGAILMRWHPGNFGSWGGPCQIQANQGMLRPPFVGTLQAKFTTSPAVSITTARTARLCLDQRVRRLPPDTGHAEDAGRDHLYEN